MKSADGKAADLKVDELNTDDLDNQMYTTLTSCRTVHTHLIASPTTAVVCVVLCCGFGSAVSCRAAIARALRPHSTHTKAFDRNRSTEPRAHASSIVCCLRPTYVLPLFVCLFVLFVTVSNSSYYVM